ncbi:MAG: transcription elongation factor GreA [Coxiellaceae bacterium]|nr:transcription elongation factor GreA [Coxiellaceae bacterium]
MASLPITVRGEQLLRKELEQLKMVERPAVIQAISEARAHGDLKENAEYHAAREQQGFIEGRLQDIESKLGGVQVIDVTKMENNGKVIFGATVTIVNVDTDEESTYQIVGEDEADIKQNKISYSAPIARAMMGKQVDDTFDFNTPQGEIASYDIIQVEYI